jgi:hypothetical protein
MHFELSCVLCISDDHLTFMDLQIGKGSLDNGYLDNGALNKYKKNLKNNVFYRYILFYL